jgi:4-hydroxy-3-methylbut-2-enyl diphosphate reductase
MKIADQYGSPDERYSYKDALVERLRATREPLVSGRLTLQLAEKLGFCWGVDRAVAMVWDALRRNPGRRLWLLNQIIHNPKVNEDFRQSGVQFVFGHYAEPGGFERVRREDLVIIPAFSAEVEHLERMKQIGCEVVDTTCPWVEKPHRRVLKYIEDGFTTLIHGHPGHDETRATCSLVDSKGGKWLVVRGLDDAQLVCSFLRGTATADDLRARFASAWSRSFHPARDLDRVGMVNQTTMLASESGQIAKLVGDAMKQRDTRATFIAQPPAAISSAPTTVASKGPTFASAASPPAIATFRDFDTICPATQDNQDAVISLTTARLPDLFLVVGGYDSSNTASLLRVAHAKHGSFHVQGPASISPTTIRHREPTTGREIETRDWLPSGPLLIALTAGASTPDTELAEVIRRLCAAAGEPLPTTIASAST